MRHGTLEAEMSVLGSMILSQRAAETAIECLEPADFLAENNQILFTALTSMVRGGREIDLVTLRNELNSKMLMPRVGGLDYIIEIANYVPSASNVVYYSAIVKDNATLRRLKAFAAQVDDLADQYLELEDETQKESEIKLQQVGQLFESVRSAGRLKHTAPGTLQDVLKVMNHHLDEAIEQNRPVQFSSRIYPSRFKEINDLTGGFDVGQILTVGARPGMGKTAWLAYELAVNAITGTPSLFASREMDKLPLALRIVSALSDVPIFEYMRRFVNEDGAFSDSMYQRWQNATNLLYENAKMHILTKVSTTTTEIATEARLMYAKYGEYPIIGDDYIQLAVNNSDRMREEISQLMRDYREIAKDFNVPVVLLSQVSRKVEDRKDKRPMLQDLKESGAIEENSDTVAFLFREEYYDAKEQHREESYRHSLEFIIAKGRMKSTGTAYLAFEPKKARVCSLKD